MQHLETDEVHRNLQRAKQIYINLDDPLLRTLPPPSQQRDSVADALELLSNIEAGDDESLKQLEQRPTVITNELGDVFIKMSEDEVYTYAEFADRQRLFALVEALTGSSTNEGKNAPDSPKQHRGTLRMRLTNEEAAAVNHVIVFVSSAKRAVAVADMIRSLSPHLAVTEVHKLVRTASREHRIKRFQSGEEQVSSIGVVPP